MNLIPPEGPEAPANYYCTWNTQNFGRGDAAKTDPAVFIGALGAERARDFLTEEALFGERGLVWQFPETRASLFFLIDDGWDVPFGVHPTREIGRFGSLELSEERFPSCTGTPEERLEKLNRMLLNAGWKGLGIWVAAQAPGETYEDGFLNGPDSDAYWAKRLRESAGAGVRYWKVDWGCRQFEPQWRQRLCNLRDLHAPGLIIEHCSPPPAPLNHVFMQDGRQISSGRFADWDDVPEQWAKAMKYSDVFRSYDVLAQFSVPSTLDRLAYLLGLSSRTGCILNCEDELYTAAVLGCSFGVMRSGLNKPIPHFDFDPQGVSGRLLEAARAQNWQRIARPFAVGTAPVWTGTETVTESWTFQKGETWFAECVGNLVFQTCPAVLQRGIEAQVEYSGADRPPVIACRFPGGPIAAGVLPRRCASGHYSSSGAAVILPEAGCGVPVGLFGSWDRVSLQTEVQPGSFQVLAQDLCADEAIDITQEVQFADGRISLSAEQLRAVSRKVPGDHSEPGLMIMIQSV